jgi:hypothetical protein
MNLEEQINLLALKQLELENKEKVLQWLQKVKLLAEQSAAATQEISKEIQDIQN